MQDAPGHGVNHEHGVGGVVLPLRAVAVVVQVAGLIPGKPDLVSLAGQVAELKVRELALQLLEVELRAGVLLVDLDAHDEPLSVHT